MFDLSQISTYLVPAIVILCLCVGYILHNLIPNETINRFIPLIVGSLGLAAAVITTVNAGMEVNIDVIVGGLVSGLASTGLYEAFKQVIEGRKE